LGRTKAADMPSIFRFLRRERENCGLLGRERGI
jgi:hypothetical protein